MSGRGEFRHDEPGFGDAAARRRRLREIHDVAGALRRPVEAPDLTAAILARVDEERPFTTERTRRLVWISRMGFAASLAVAALGIALLHSAAPDLVRLRHEAQPVSDVMQTAKVEASARYQSIRTTFSSVGSLAAAGDLRVAQPGMTEAHAGVAQTVAWDGGADARLAPLPPAYGATYLSLSAASGAGRDRGFDAAVIDAARASGPVVSAVRLSPSLMPRPLAADAQPSAVYWGGGRLSTAPSASMTIPVMLEPGQFGAGVGPGGPGTSGFVGALQRFERAVVAPGAVWTRGGGGEVGARTADQLTPAGAAIDDATTTVPR